MTRLKQISRKDIHPAAEPLFQRIFAERDPTVEPGTGSGTPGDWWTVFASVPDLFDHAVSGFAFYKAPGRKLDPQLRELGQARAGYACGSQFVFSQHSKAARDAGISENKVQALPHWQAADCFSQLERAVLAYTDALAWERGRVPDGVFDVLKEGMCDEAILELTYVVCMYIMHAVMSRALRLEYDNVPERVVEIPAPGGETGLAATMHEPSAT